MILNYLLGALLGALSGAVAVFFAQGGLARRALFRRLSRMPGRWHAQRVRMLCYGVAIGVYGIWLYGAPGRSLCELLALASFLLAVSVTDIRRRMIPMDAVLFYGAVCVLCRLSALSLSDVLDAMLGAALGMALLGLPHLLRREAVGAGDVWVLTVCGTIAGFPGVAYLLLRALLALAVASLVQLLRKKASVKSEMPLTPFLLFAALI